MGAGSGQFAKNFHTHSLFYRFSHWVPWSATPLGMLCCGLVFSGCFAVQDRYKFTFRHFFNEKLMKYIPIEDGGNSLFPFQLITALGKRECPKTQWNSFDQRSYFPHTDKFKMKIAICHEDLPLIKTLLSRNFDIDSLIDTKKQLTPMALSATLGRVELIEYFFSHGSSLNCRDFEGNTPLMLAVIHDHPAAAKKLIHLGASIEARDRYGFSVVDKARNRGKNTIAEFLEGVTQKEPQPLINPVTYKLEDFEYLGKDSGREIVERFSTERYYKPVIYPYYRSSQGFLMYLFGGYDLENIEQILSGSAFLNMQDDRCSSDQQLYTFGSLLEDNISK